MLGAVPGTCARSRPAVAPAGPRASPGQVADGAAGAAAPTGRERASSIFSQPPRPTCAPAGQRLQGRADRRGAIGHNRTAPTVAGSTFSQPVLHYGGTRRGRQAGVPGAAN